MGIPVQVIRLGVLGVVVGGVVAFKVIASNKVEKKVDAFLASEGIPKEMVSYDASVDLFGFETRLEDIVIKNRAGKDIKIDEIVINDFDDEHKIPQYVDVEINGMHSSSNQLKVNPMTRAMFKDIDADDIVSNFALAYSFDEKDKKLEIKNASTSVEGLGEISLEAEIEDVKSLQQLAQNVMYYGFKNLKLGKSSLKYEDDGFANMAFAYNAQQRGMSTEEFKEMAVKNLDRSLEKAKQKEDDLQVAFLEAVEDFVKHPNSFEVSIEPKEALSLRELQYSHHNLNDALKALNLKVEAN